MGTITCRQAGQPSGCFVGSGVVAVGVATGSLFMVVSAVH
jgi:hypothetical protein